VGVDSHATATMSQSMEHSYRIRGQVGYVRGMNPPWLFAFGAVVVLALVAVVARFWAPRPLPATSALLRWASERGHQLRRDDHIVEVVGALGNRRFTVALHPGPPAVLLLAIDCDADVESEGPVARVQDGALVSRITGPEAAHVEDLDALLAALAEAAASVEVDAPLLGPDLAD